MTCPSSSSTPLASSPWERLGTDEQGWTKRKARDVLEQRLVDVRREAYRRPSGTTFGELATEWLETYPAAKGLKRTTRDGYKTIVNRHLLPALGNVTLDRLDVATLDRYVADRLRDGLGTGSANRHLNVISLRQGRPQARPMRRTRLSWSTAKKEPRRRWRILTPARYPLSSAPSSGSNGRRPTTTSAPGCGSRGRRSPSSAASGPGAARCSGSVGRG